MKIVKSLNYYGKYDIVPVSDEFYEHYLELDNEGQKEYRKNIRHNVCVSPFELDGYIRYSTSSPVEDALIAAEENREFHRLLKKLTPTQKRRVDLLLDGVHLNEMPTYEHACYNSLKESVRAAYDRVQELKNAKNR